MTKQLNGASDFQSIYMSSLWACMHGTEEMNKRTGHSIRQVPGGLSFKLDLADRLLPVPGVRKVYPRTAAAEIMWFVRGEQDLEWFERYSKIWSKFKEDDTDIVLAGYGYRWRKAFDRDQLGLAIQALRDNPSDRRIYISAWDPREDGLGAPNQKNVPCPVGFSLSIVGGHLHSSLFIRSSDVMVGLPYDTMGQTLLMGLIAAELGVELGSLHITLAHPHVYDSHYDLVKECQTNWVTHVPTMPIPQWKLSDAEAHPDDYVKYIDALAKTVEWPEFDPRPELIL